MKEQPEPAASMTPVVAAVQPKRHINIFKVAGTIAVLMIFFVSGIAVGNGNITLFKSKVKSQNKNLPAKLDYSSVDKIYATIKDNYDGQLDQSKLLDGLKTGLAEATDDPYTVYLNPTLTKQFNDQLNGTFTGIGAELGKDDRNNLIVISPIAGFPAEKAGLQSKDIIAQVDGKTTAGLTIDEAVTKIRGPKGSTVKLDLIRNDKPLSITITRDNIKIASVKSEILDGNIGYLQITQFSDDTGELALQAARKFKDANVKGVILDMRGDPGGLLTAAVDVSSLWLRDGSIILQEKRGNVVEKTYPASGDGLLKGVKTVVLIDGGSASASEITAGALSDNKAATLIGVKSFGKGSVQQLIKYPDGSELKVTVAHWFTPSGKTINKTGISPDQTVEATSEEIKAGNDKQKQAAIDFINK